MGSQDLYVDPSAMNNDGRRTIGTSEALFDEVIKLKNCMDQLAAIWGGEAEAAFDVAFGEMALSLSRFSEQLDDRGVGMQMAGNLLSETDQEAAVRARNLGNHFREGGY